MRPVSWCRAIRATLAGLALAGWLLAAACTRQPAPELARDELFTLSLGPLDEQLDLFRVGGAAARRSTGISMRDGLFYIANGNARKIMQLSSYGDLLLLIYDPRSNPAPVGMAAAAATRLAVPHALHAPSQVAVASGPRLFVVDAAAAAPAAADAGPGQLVRRFGARGQPLGSIGREGAGGTPFPHVQRLTVTADDTLVVTARTPRQWWCYWYDAAGELLDQVALPYTGQLGGAARLLVWEVLPHRAARRLFLFVDALPAEPGAGAAARVRDAPGVRIYDVASRSVVGSFALPASGSRRSAGAAAGPGEELAAPAYYPLGVTTDGMLFLTRRENDQTHSLVVLGRDGRVVTRRRFGLDETGLGFVSLGMSPGGVLFGLLAEADRAQVVWWRSDLLLDQAAPRTASGR